MKKLLFVLLFFSYFNALLSQSAEEIKNSKDYLWGEGWGESIREADNMALQAMVGKISIQVESSFSNVENEVDTNGEVESKTAIQSVMKTYSQATITNTGQLVLSLEPDARVLRYVKREEIDKIFEGRRNKVLDMIEMAVKAEAKLKIDDVLRYYYWSYCLLRSLPDANHLSLPNQKVFLTTWIPNKMNEVFGNITVVKQREEEGFVTLQIAYQGKPVASFDYTYFDGRGYTNIYSATDGIGIMEMQPGVSTDNLKIKCEYEFLGESQIDKEIATVVEVMKGRNFRNAYISVLEEGLASSSSQENPASVLSSTVASLEMGKLANNEFEQLESVMKQIINSIKSKDFHSVEVFFTDEGKDMFRRLLEYGNARILEEPKLNYLRMGDEMICRSIPMSFRFKNNNRRFVEKVTFVFNAEKKINCIAFALGDDATADILGRANYSEQARLVLIRFLENYKTAFALKRIEYIRSIFDDNAIIITGTQVKTSSYKNQEEKTRFLDNKIIRYNRFTKNEYMKHLERSFNSNEFINIRFANNDIVKAGGSYGEVYGIQIKQDYYSTNYGDTGYLFLYVDLNDSDNPIIKVRTWQPERDPNFGLYGLGDF